jgi:uncharacterized caspase-like protein
MFNGVNEARTMVKAVRGLGLDSEELVNGTTAAMDRAVAEFDARIDAGEVAVFYYSGRGVQVAGANHLVPVDFDGDGMG